MSVHSLPNEVWSEILKGYSTPDRRTLLPILSVSKRLYRLTVPLIYQSIFVIRIIEDTTDLELITNFPCTPIYVHALSSLLSTLRARYPLLDLALGAHIKSFVFASAKVEGLTLDLRASVNSRELEDAFFTNIHAQERKVEAILNEKYWILENLRCLEVMCDQVQAQLSLMKVLGSLRCVEYVRITAPIEMTDRIKTDEFLKIPSQNLKYILIGSKHAPSRYYFTAVALFEHFPSLVIVDFASHDGLVEPKKRFVVRFFRGRVRGFKMVRLEVCPPLEQWWEEVERMVKMESSGL
ncbi:hypothetical protein ONZ45_g16363 [Pleurotus djamor]|nr:hypothetical protein ONZ45_g16363 [Pleurotus djamor]